MVLLVVLSIFHPFKKLISQKNLTDCTYMNGATDERLVGVAMLHLDKQLLLLSFVTLVTTLTDVNGFIDSTCEVH